MNFKSILKELSISCIGAVLSGLLALVLYVAGSTHAVLPVKYGLLIFSIPLWIGIVRDIFRGKFGVDLIAGVALAATFFFGQYLAGLVVLIMLSGGETLEAFAMQRAKRELSQLLEHAPRIAHIKKDSEIVDVAVEEVVAGAVVVVKPGEIIPVDGVVVEGVSTVDESAMTGESVPEDKRPGSAVISGTRNTSALLVIRATHDARESRFEEILRLVKEAQESRSPLVRLADKYSVYFTVLTFAIAGGTYFLTGDTTRMLAVLVVATPCPLILATPIAIISGMSRAARRGVIIKTGGALEVLARAKTFAFDKTGTITLGVPKVVRVDSFGAEPVDVVAVAASLDQCSAHVLAQALVTHARSLGKELIYPELCKESFGQGIEGTIAASLYRFGSLSFLEANGVDITAVICTHHEQALESGVMSVYLSKGTAVVGSVLFADEIRSDAKDLFTTLRAIPGVRLFMLSGDKEAVAKKIAAQIGLEEVHAQCLPEDKVRIITELPAPQRPAVMIGDGINDAPALAVADVGIALGSAGKTASSDAASIVIVSGSITRVGEVVMVARRALGVATQGILIGIGLSTVGMLFGAFGFVPPLAGALLQEAIDVIVILNALRVARS